jgi:prepilin-type N-terminal cleavage/methylation domain-containing protein
MKNYLVLLLKLNRKNMQGFTLIELLVVIIILGILASLATPLLLGQIAKGRQAEARAALGLINRAQQGYRYENGIFGTLSNLAVEAVSITPKFYVIREVGTPSAFGAAYQLNAVPQFADDIKNYAGASGQTAAGAYTGIVCEDETPLDDDVSTNNIAGVLNCVNGIRIN